jgi:aspartate/methionine/tyrosine aminotransferase
MVFINPGNPTGQCLSRTDMEALVRFCYEQRIVLLADEVYQELVYEPETAPFLSAHGVMHSMGAPWSKGLELFSFHSASKGTSGECGLRGGYVQMSNIHPKTFEEFYKLASISLCPNTMGQVWV